MPKVTTQDCKDQIANVLSNLKWKRISKTRSGSDVPNTTKRVLESGIFRAHVYTDDADEKFISIKFLLKQACERCTEEVEPGSKDDPNALERKIPRLTEDEFCKISEDWDARTIYECPEEDRTVHFDLENRNGDGTYCVENLGFYYMGFEAGGDWEWPVYFILYWDGERVRCYIPEKGNSYNTDTMWAYGNRGEFCATLSIAMERGEDVEKKYANNPRVLQLIKKYKELSKKTRYVDEEDLGDIDLMNIIHRFPKDFEDLIEEDMPESFDSVDSYARIKKDLIREDIAEHFKDKMMDK